MPVFAPEVVAAVARHMNMDHTEDNLVICRANGIPEATAATFEGLDEHGGSWQVTTPAGTASHTIAWPDGPISERAQIRREVVVLYRAACAALGIEPRTEERPPRGLSH